MSVPDPEFARCPMCANLWPSSLSACPADGTNLADATILAKSPQGLRAAPPEVTDPTTSYSPTRRAPDPARQAPPSDPEITDHTIVWPPTSSEEPESVLNSAPPRMRAQTPIPVPISELRQGTVVGEFEVLGKLGEGGMGTVYSAVHPVIGKKVAIKVIADGLAANSDCVERFLQEARAVNSIGHAGIIDIFSFGSLPDGRPYFVMEWLHGEPVASRLRRGPLDTAGAAHILDEMCCALEAAHEKGIIHRDLKPDNVFLVAARGARPIVKLLDFGLAKLIGPTDARVQRTRTGAIIGTPLYLSPEQARAEDVGAPTDVYALGCMAFELLVGRPPFVEGSPMDVIVSQMQTKAPAPSSVRPGIAPELDRLVLQMLEKNPVDRPSLAEIRTVLRPLLSAIAAPAASLPPAAAPRAPSLGLVGPGEAYRVPTRPALIIAGMVVVLLGVAIGSVAFRRDRSVEPPMQAALDGGPVVPPAVAAAAPEPKVTGAIVVTVDRPARIEIDGQAIVESATTARLDVDRVGDYRLVVTAPGRITARKTVSVAEGATVEVPVRLARSVASRTGSRTTASSAPTAPTIPSAGPTAPVTRPNAVPSKTSQDPNSTINPFKRKEAAP